VEENRPKERSARGLERAAQDMGGTISTLLDKLAGKESDIRLSFEDLTLDAGMMKVRLNGAIVLDIVYAKDSGTSGK
jgi:hypothetical protein